MAGLGGSLGYAMGAMNWGSLGMQYTFHFLNKRIMYQIIVISRLTQSYTPIQGPC